jgi:biopolymer transport protein ExbB/biopolymer transport protein TolQ
MQQLTKFALLGTGWVLYLLILLSVLSITALLERLWFFRRNKRGSEQLREVLGPALLRNDLPAIHKALTDPSCVEARILNAAYAWRSGGPEAVRDALDAELDRQRPVLSRGSSILGTIGSNAPFVGLLGTVIGVIEAFHHLGSSGAGGDAAMGNVMRGISEALVTTGVGLFVAIPAVVSYNVVQDRIEEIEGHTTSLGRLLTAWLKTHPQTDSTDAGQASRRALAVAGGE